MPHEGGTVTWAKMLDLVEAKREKLAEWWAVRFLFFLVHWGVNRQFPDSALTVSTHPHHHGFPLWWHFFLPWSKRNTSSMKWSFCQALGPSDQKTNTHCRSTMHLPGWQYDFYFLELSHLSSLYPILNPSCPPFRHSSQAPSPSRADKVRSCPSWPISVWFFFSPSCSLLYFCHNGTWNVRLGAWFPSCFHLRGVSGAVRDLPSRCSGCSSLTILLSIHEMLKWWCLILMTKNITRTGNGLALISTPSCGSDCNENEK